MKAFYTPEILINTTRVGLPHGHGAFEFVLNDTLTVTECVRIESLIQGTLCPVSDFRHALAHVLFELNHVRVNPRLDNSHIITIFTDALQSAGVRVLNPPCQDAMAVCYQPLGEIIDHVRLYFDAHGQVVFLSPRARFQVIHNPLLG